VYGLKRLLKSTRSRAKPAEPMQTAELAAHSENAFKSWLSDYLRRLGHISDADSHLDSSIGAARTSDADDGGRKCHYTKG
jgi:hypothetical protein